MGKHLVGFSDEDVIQAIAAVAEKALGRMLTYLQVTHIIANRPENFPSATLICKHEDLSILAPGHRFAAVALEESAPEVDQDTLAQIIYLAAATLDLQVIDSSKLGKNQKLKEAFAQPRGGS